MGLGALGASTERGAATGLASGCFTAGGPHPHVSLRSRPVPETPIYVGKAVPAGARKGGFGLDVAPGTVLFSRLAEHADSIRQAENLDLADFRCRYLVVDDIWIPLGESRLIQMFSPVWNCIIDGFGNHDPGKGHHQGQVPTWDVLHPGRAWAGKLQKSKRSADELLAAIADFLKAQPKP